MLVWVSSLASQDHSSVSGLVFNLHALSRISSLTTNSSSRSVTEIFLPHDRHTFEPHTGIHHALITHFYEDILEKKVGIADESVNTICETETLRHSCEVSEQSGGSPQAWAQQVESSQNGCSRTVSNTWKRNHKTEQSGGSPEPWVQQEASSQHGC